MTLGESSTGRPLSSPEWLEAHHQAKLPERTAYATRLAELQPKSIVDLGCATGLWLDLLNSALPPDCRFIGIDNNEDSLKLARSRSRTWARSVVFMNLDIEKQANLIPPADLTLAFNIFPYISDLPAFLEVLSARHPHGAVAVRQYDGAALRFGPLSTVFRQRSETELRVAVEGSRQFRHYDLDRVFSALDASSYENREYGFELFSRFSPYPDDFLDYFHGTLEWTRTFLSKESAEQLEPWISERALESSYFYEVDLVSLLS